MTAHIQTMETQDAMPLQHLGTTIAPSTYDDHLHELSDYATLLDNQYTKSQAASKPPPKIDNILQSFPCRNWCTCTCIPNQSMPCRRQPSKHQGSSIILQGTNVKVLVAPLSCLRQSNVFSSSSFNSYHMRRLPSVTNNASSAQTKQTTSSWCNCPTYNRETCNCQSDKLAIWNWNRIGVINPLSIAASNQVGKRVDECPSKSE